MASDWHGPIGSIGAERAFGRARDGGRRLVAEPEWQPIARMRTHEQVLAEIEQRLRSGGLGSGDRLPPERQLAEALGVSRGAVREALRILEAIGVVEAGTGSGPAAGSIIVNDSTSGLSMVLRMHLQTSSLRHDDLVEVRVAHWSDLRFARWRRRPTMKVSCGCGK
jgi:DNA-binding transcriptional MocR family regulator